MAKYGLIGDPIKGSGSPALFEAAYKGVKDGEYSYDLIEGSDFEASFQRFIDEYAAVNVTAPFKERAYSKVLEMVRKGEGGGFRTGGPHRCDEPSGERLQWHRGV